MRPFDWATWRSTPDGQRLTHDPDAITSASVDDLDNVLTTCLRADRFCEGYLAEAFDNGLLTRVLVRAEALLTSHEAPTQYAPTQ